jgi:hypothetical protein
MMLPICGFLVIAQAAQGVSAEAIPVQHMRPSKLVEILNQIQPSTVLTADDEKGLLYVRAGKETIAEYKSYASLFDVKPRRVRVAMAADSEIDRESTSFETVVANNKKFAFNDTGMGLDVKIAARINDDNTVTVFVEPSYKQKATTIVVRVKHGGYFSLGLMPDGTLTYSSQPGTGEGDKPIGAPPTSEVVFVQDARGSQKGTVRKWPTLRFKVAIEEDTTSKAK